MKTLPVALLCLIVLLQLPIQPAKAQVGPKIWAVIICGTKDLPMTDDVAYVWGVLYDHYYEWLGDVYYLDMEGYGDEDATKPNVRSALADWLGAHSTSIDTIFIVIGSHGGGYNHKERRLVNIDIDHIDQDGDEGPEVRESWIKPDGDPDTWLGVDECLILSEDDEFTLDEKYWDDEMKEDLEDLSYSKLVLVTMSCYNGGLIDDLSGENRIIMSSANETYQSYSDESGVPPSWLNLFASALDVSTQAFSDADLDWNGGVSMWEAWYYATSNDHWHQIGWETPWLDDNGNGLPTFINGTDHIDNDDGNVALQTHLNLTLNRPMTDTDISCKTVIGQGYAPKIEVNVTNLYVEPFSFMSEVFYDDVSIDWDEGYVDVGGSTSLWIEWYTTGVPYGTYQIYAKTYTEFEPYESERSENFTVQITVPGDVNGDCVVDMADITTMIEIFMTTPGDPKWNPNCDVNCDDVVDMADISIAIVNFDETC